MPTIDNFYVRDRALILPGSFQRSSYLSEVLEDIGNGFSRIDAKVSIASGTSSTLTSTSERSVFFTGNSLTYTLTLPTATTSLQPPIKIYNCGTGNVITISGGASKIMSGSTGGEITLRCPGDYIELQYIDSTIGWAILAIRSNRMVTISANGSLRLNRFQKTMIDGASAYTLNILPPTDSQVGEICEFSMNHVSSVSADAISFNSVSIITPIAAEGFLNVRAWNTASGWVVGQFV